MSIGLEDDNSDIDRALEAAINPNKDELRGRIVLAAAANGGGNDRCAFPARRTGVIAIHATDKKGNRAEFNPDPEGDSNFATLGVDIYSKWDGYRVSASGTSYATPIAAGIAANILEFARHNLQLTKKDKDWLYSARGMRMVLSRLSNLRPDGYRYIRFWRKQDGNRVDEEYLCELLRKAIDADRV